MFQNLQILKTKVMLILNFYEQTFDYSVYSTESKIKISAIKTSSGLRQSSGDIV